MAVNFNSSGYGGGTLPASLEIDRNRQRSRGGARMMFPEDLGRQGMLINFANYQYNAGGGVQGVSNDSIILPLPKQLNETSSLQVDGKELGIIGAGVADIVGGGLNFEQMGASTASGLMNLIGGIGEQSLSEFFGSAGQGAAGVARFLARAGLGSLSPEIGFGIDAATGTAVNPHTTLTFDGVALKTHTFNWELSPKTPAESDALRDIIRYVKAQIHPTFKNPLYEGAFAGSSIERGLLSYPKVANISFLGISQDYYFFMKPSMVREFTVDYAPQGQAILSGGKPAFINIQMSVVEQAIHTADDYGRTSGGQFTEEQAIDAEAAAMAPLMRDPNGPGAGR